VTASTRVLDLGGTPYFWQLAAGLNLPVPEVTVVNLLPPPGALPPRLHWVQADATRVPFADASFDVAFSNSVIEHLHNREAQAGFASEVRRVAPHRFVQTPSVRFPVEQHLWGLGVHWAPLAWRPHLMRWTTLAGLTARFDLPKCRAFSRELVLLDRSRLSALFPGDRIVVERLLGLEKSLIAVA
jgi:hypothetical protein